MRGGEEVLINCAGAQSNQDLCCYSNHENIYFRMVDSSEHMGKLNPYCLYYVLFGPL